MNHGGYSVFAGVGERTREGNDLYHEMIEGGVIKVDKATGKPIAGSKVRPPAFHPHTSGLSTLTLHIYYSR